METLASAYTQTLFRALDSVPHEPIRHDGQILSLTLDSLPVMMTQSGMTRPFVVVDNPALHAAKLNCKLISLLDNRHPTYFTQFSPNPTSTDAANAAQQAAINGCDGVIAIGGGSCCDVAKIVALSATRPELINELSQGISLERANPLPFIAAPTTAGTGSESTHFAAIYVEGRKVSVGHKALRPSCVILDERFQFAMPQKLAACSGLDALCQAMESIWAVGSTDESLAYARIAGPLIAENLTKSVLSRDHSARRAMMIGAHLAGKAINISKTTAAHALSYQLTQACGLSHGHAVALTIGEIARWNADANLSDCLDPRGHEWVTKRVDEACSFLDSNPSDLADVMLNLLARLGSLSSLADLNIPDSLLVMFANTVDPVRVSNNPRKLDPSITHTILQRAAGHASMA